MPSAKLPSLQFYPGDWRKDAGVQSLTYHDRGVWWELICLMHESEDRGKLLLNGKAMPEDALARLLGLDKQHLVRTLTQLLELGVASRDEATGALMCRRMVKDEHKRLLCSEAGKRGGNPKMLTWRSMPGFIYAMQRNGAGPIKIGASVEPQNRKGNGKSSGSLKGPGIVVLRTWRVREMGPAEECIHQLFSDRCFEGEWFSIDPGDLDDVARELTLKGHLKGDPTPSSSPSVSSSSSEEEIKTVIAAQPPATASRKSERPPPAVETVKPRRQKAPAVLTPEQQEIRQAFGDWWISAEYPRRHGGEPYEFEGGRDAPAVLKLLRSHQVRWDLEVAKRVARFFLDQPEAFAAAHRLWHLGNNPGYWFRKMKERAEGGSNVINPRGKLSITQPTAAERGEFPERRNRLGAFDPSAAVAG